MPSPFFTPHDGTGTVLRFGADVYTVTNIVISNTNPAAAADSTIDVAHLGQTAGEQAARLARPLVIPAEDGGTGRQVTFDYIGKAVLLDGATATVYIAIGSGGAVTAMVGSTGAAATNYFATVASSTLTLATNDAIRGQGVLSLARTAAMTG